MSKEKAVTTSETQLPAELSGSWGAAEALDATDIQIPKIWHMQAMSKGIKSGDVKVGDFIDSITGEVLCTKDKPLELIIFGAYKNLQVFEQSRSGKFEYVKSERVTPANATRIANLPWLDESVTPAVRNSLQYNFYCLLPEKLLELPYVISFSSTKTKTARNLATMLEKLDRLKRPSASYVFKFTNFEDSNDNGSWQGLEVSQGRATTVDELKVAYDWYKKSVEQKLVAAEVDDAHDIMGDEDISY